MSGGSMDYVAWKIKDAARYIQQQLGELELRKKHGRLLSASDYDKERHPEVEYLKTPEAFTDAVISRMRDALVCVRRAAIYAERVEWLTSSDDDYESFCLRTDKQLKDCEEHGGVE